MQSRKLSLGLAAGGVALAVVLFIVLSGGDESDSDSTTSTVRTTTTTTGGPPTTTTTVPKPPRVVFRNGAPVGGVQEIEVDKGDPVRIDLTTRRSGGGCTSTATSSRRRWRPDQTARLDFRASLDGVFEIELHLHGGADEGSEVQVAELKVTP